MIPTEPGFWWYLTSWDTVSIAEVTKRDDGFRACHIGSIYHYPIDDNRFKKWIGKEEEPK